MHLYRSVVRSLGVNEHWCFCGACRERTRHSLSVQYLTSDEHGKIGKYNIFICGQCNLVNTTEFHRLVWLVVDKYTVIKGFTKELDANRYVEDKFNLSILERELD